MSGTKDTRVGGRFKAYAEPQGDRHLLRRPPRVWHTYAMRTTLELDDRLMNALLAKHPDSTKAEAVARAIESYIREDAYEGLRAMRGTLEVEDVSAGLRAIDRTS